MRTELLKNGRRVALIAGSLSKDEVNAKNLGIDFDDVKIVDEIVEAAAFEADLARSRAEAANRPTPVPKFVTKRQAFLALLDIGIRESDIRTVIASLPDAEKEVAEIEFNYATHFERKHPLIQIIADAKGLDSSKLDTLFVKGSSL